ncbi:MAG: phosphoribosyltransferase [Puniceicoccales bacterium]|nr:phosphoribosyltransferase [Puniceicoccales bacterium]
MKPRATLFALGNGHPGPLPEWIRRGHLERKTFHGGNCDIVVPPQETVGPIFLWATKDLECSSGQRFWELTITAEALGEFCGEAPDLLLPYCDGCRSHQPSTVRALARSLAALPVRSIVFFDLHREDILQLLPGKAIHLPTFPLWAQFYKNFSPPLKFVIAPDLGRANAVADLAKLLAVESFVLDKNRPEEPLPSAIRGRHVLLFDDEVVSGSTLRGALDRLRQAGAGSVTIAVTYALCQQDVLAQLAAEPSVRSLTIGDLIARPKVPDRTVPLAFPLLEQFLRLRDADEQRARRVPATGPIDRFQLT